MEVISMCFVSFWSKRCPEDPAGAFVDAFKEAGFCRVLFGGRPAQPVWGFELFAIPRRGFAGRASLCFKTTPP